MEEKKKSLTSRIPAKVWLLISFLAAMAVWYALSVIPATSRAFPNIIVTAEGLLTMIERGAFWQDLSSSMISVFSGYALGFVIALPVAILMAWYVPVRNILEPWIQFIRNIPPLAYVPLIVICAGVGRRPQIIVITIACFLIMCVTIFQGVINVDETLIKSARELGYFTEEGLDVTLTSFQDGPTIIAAMEHGSINFGYIGDGAHRLCVLGQAEIIGLSHISNGDAVIGGPNVASLEDLAGKTVAYSSGTSSETILVNALNSVGLTMDDITAMDMDASAVVTAMLSGGVDACAIWSPQSLTILDEMPEATKLAQNTDFSDISISLASWIAMPSYLEANHDVAVRFMRALFKAMDYAALEENYEQVSQWVADELKLDVASVLPQARGDADWLTGQEVAASVADGTVEGYYALQQEMMLTAGSITEEDVCPVGDYVNFDLMTEAGTY